MDQAALWRRLLAELLGSAFLAAVVIGSGIAAQQLSPGAVGLELFENAAATAAGLYAIILMFGPVSGAHFNPVVSFVDAAFGGLSWRQAWAYLPAQVAGCIVRARSSPTSCSRKAAVSHLDPPPGHAGRTSCPRSWPPLGLILVIFALARSGRGHVAPAAVGAYIGAAYFFTSSTSFANPAIAVGRMFSNTFAGIAPSSVPAFIGAEVVGGALAWAVVKAALSRTSPPAEAADGGRPSPPARWRLGRQSSSVDRANLRRRPGRRHGRPRRRARCTSSPSGAATPASAPRCEPGSSNPAPRSPWWWPTPTRTSPSAASPTTSRERSPTGATWRTGASPTWKPPGWRLRLDTLARRIDVEGHRLLVTNRRRRRGAPVLRRACGRHRRPARPPADRRPGRARRPGRRRRRPPVALHGRHLRRDAHPGRTRSGQRRHRGRRLHRPGDGRGAGGPGPAGDPDGTAPRGPPDGRPRAWAPSSTPSSSTTASRCSPAPRCARSPGRRAGRPAGCG